MPSPKIRNFFTLFLIVAVLEGVSALIGFATAPAADPWYAALNKAPWNPPPFVFWIVWPALYALMGVALWRLWLKRGETSFPALAALFATQLALNWPWNFLFFTYHMLLLSFIWILALISVVAALIWLAWKADRIAAWCLVPYLLWLGYAASLSGYIWWMN